MIRTSGCLGRCFQSALKGPQEVDDVLPLPFRKPVESVDDQVCLATAAAMRSNRLNQVFGPPDRSVVRAAIAIAAQVGVSVSGDARLTLARGLGVHVGQDRRVGDGFNSMSPLPKVGVGMEK